jgi:hypothetical protein
MLRCSNLESLCRRDHAINPSLKVGGILFPNERRVGNSDVDRARRRIGMQIKQ